jgi:imidazolonepropionase-like amidohydrolase
VILPLVLAAVGQLALVDCDVRPVTSAPLSGATILIQGDAIRDFGLDVDVPDDAEIIDCAGRIVTPGLIDADTQLGLVEISLDPLSNDAMPATKRAVRAALDARDALDARSSLIPVARRHGVTSAITAPVGGVVEGQAAWIDLVDPESRHAQDAVQGPVALAVNLGQFGGAFAGQSRLGAHAMLREFLDDATAYRRNPSAYARRDLYPMHASRLDLEAAQPVLRQRVPLLVEVHRAADIRAALRVAEAYDIDIAVVGGAEAWLVAEELAAARVPVIVDATSNLPFQLEGRNNRADNAALLARAGVRVALSTRRTHNVGNLRFHLGNAVRAGLPPEVALRAATRVPAEIFGRERGAIERGVLADLVVWSGDPFEPASTADIVLIRGERQPTETRQTRLADRYIRALGLGE